MKTAVFFLIAAPVALLADQIVVPLSNPGQPVTIRVSMITGSVSVTGAARQDVMVDSSFAGRARGHARDRDAAPPPGMHRIDLGSGEEISEDRNVVTIRPAIGRDDHIVIEAPAAASLEIKSVSCGKTDVTGITGDIEVECTNGALELKNVSGSVVAHTINGSITAQIDRPAPDKPMSFTSFNGKVDVTLPADTKARLRLKTNNGEVYTDFDVKLDSGSRPIVEDNRGKSGRYRIAMDRSVTGTINGGGPEYLFQTMNGDILIHRK